MLWCPNSGNECQEFITPNPKTAFIILADAPNIQEIQDIKNIIIDVLIKKGFSYKLGVNIKKRGNVLCKICKTIQSVALVIVIHSKATIEKKKKSLPNIFYEAGIAHFLCNEVIFIGYQIKRPSDLEGIEWIHSQDLKELKTKFNAHMDSVIKEDGPYSKRLGKLFEKKNYEKSITYYMKSVLLTLDKGSIKKLKELNEKIKDEKIFANLSERLENFLGSIP